MVWSILAVETARSDMTQHRLHLRRPGQAGRLLYGAVADSLARALVISGLSTATLVLAFAIAQVA